MKKGKKEYILFAAGAYIVLFIIFTIIHAVMLKTDTDYIRWYGDSTSFISRLDTSIGDTLESVFGLIFVVAVVYAIVYLLFRFANKRDEYGKIVQIRIWMKVLFGLSWLPYIYTLWVCIVAAINGTSTGFFGGDRLVYGFEAVVNVLPWVVIFLCLTCILPIAIIIQVTYFIMYYKARKNLKKS